MDIAMLQSLVCDGEVKPFIKEYGLVIVDECHHVSAAGFEQVLRAVCARYVYGLTATPTRQMGMNRLSRCSAGQSVTRSALPNKPRARALHGLWYRVFTRFAMPLTTEKMTYATICEALIRDTLRNN